MHRCPMHLHSDVDTKGAQAHSCSSRLAGKIYNAHFSRFMPDMSEEDDGFEDEDFEKDEDEFGHEDDD